MEIQQVTYDMKEGNVNMKLTIVETVGYGDQINKEESSDAIVQYIDSNYQVIWRGLSVIRDSKTNLSIRWKIDFGF